MSICYRTTVPNMMAPIVDELWNGLEVSGFHPIDSRRWGQQPVRGLETETIIQILFQRRIPPEHSKNVRLISKDGAAAFLYALSSDDKHFWGISPSVISHLANQQDGLFQSVLKKTKSVVPWAIVLLDGDWRTGYWFDSDTVLKRRKEWRPRGDIAYLVGGNVMKCREDTEGSRRFLSSASLLKLLTELLNEYSSGSSEK